MAFSARVSFFAIALVVGHRELFANRPGNSATTSRWLAEWEQLLLILQGRGGRKAERLANGSVISPDPKAHRDFQYEVMGKGLEDSKMHLFLDPASEDLRLFSHEAYLKVLEHYAATHKDKLHSVFFLRMYEDDNVGSDEANGLLFVARAMVRTLQGELDMDFGFVDENGCSDKDWRRLLDRRMGNFPNTYVTIDGSPGHGPFRTLFELTVFKPTYEEITEVLPYWAWTALEMLLDRTKVLKYAKASKPDSFWAKCWHRDYEEDAEKRAKEIEQAQAAGLWI